MDYETEIGKEVLSMNVSPDGGKKTQAGNEAKNFMFGKIPNSEFVTCIDSVKDAIYILGITGEGAKQVVWCSCDYFKKAENVCEHLIALRNLRASDLGLAPADIEEMLQDIHGWVISDGLLIPPGKLPVVVSELPPQTEEQLKAPVSGGVAVCEFCKLEIKAGTQETADKRYETHKKVCKENPANQKTETPAAPKKAKKETPKQSTEMPKVDPPDVPEPTKKAQPDKEKPTTAVSTDVKKMPSDAAFRDAKTERILQSQGGFYRVSGGDEVPDAMAVQAYAVGKAGISTEVIKVEQDANHALAIVRCHRGGVYTDASVYIDFAIQRKRELLKVANKNLNAVRGWDENGPLFDPDFNVVTRKKSTPLMVYLFNRMTDFAYFAPRTAESQAARRAQSKMLGTEWRDNEEINTEAEEVSAGNKG